MTGPGLHRVIPSAVLHDVATALVIANAAIDQLKEEIRELRAENARLRAEIAGADTERPAP